MLRSKFLSDEVGNIHIKLKVSSEAW